MEGEQENAMQVDQTSISTSENEPIRPVVDQTDEEMKEDIPQNVRRNRRY